MVKADQGPPITNRQLPIAVHQSPVTHHLPLQTHTTMNSLLAFILTEIVRQAPALALDLVQILSKPAPTEEDWAQLRQRYAGRPYDQYLRDAQTAATTNTRPA